jgi:hypothetical protein
MTAAVILALAATAVTGLLAGASLDQSIKQLPSRKRLGLVQYSNYSRAADLGTGLWWYSLLGVSAALLSAAAGIYVLTHAGSGGQRAAGIVCAALALLHSFTTTRAAPILLSQRLVVDDVAVLTRIFTKFVRWQTVRVILQTLNFFALLWLLAELL